MLLLSLVCGKFLKALNALTEWVEGRVRALFSNGCLVCPIYQRACEKVTTLGRGWLKGACNIRDGVGMECPTYKAPVFTWCTVVYLQVMVTYSYPNFLLPVHDFPIFVHHISQIDPKCFINVIRIYGLHLWSGFWWAACKVYIFILYFTVQCSLTVAAAAECCDTCTGYE